MHFAEGGGFAGSRCALCEEKIQVLSPHLIMSETCSQCGMGKRLFDKGTIPDTFTMVDAKTSPSGVIVATLKRAGK